MTVVFKPPAGGPRNVLTLATSCARIEAHRAACEARDDVASARCIQVAALESGLAGNVVGLQRVDPKTFRFRFPDSDALVGTAGDDLGLSGPAAVAITAADAALPCALASGSCESASGVLACIDRLFASEAGCTPVPHRTFAHFTALPAPNSYQAVCTAPIPPCDPTPPPRTLRMAVDTEGNLLVPMDWRGVLVDRDAVPVARLLRGASGMDAFPDRPGPLVVPDASALGSFSLQGVKIPPIFDPQIDPASTGEPPSSARRTRRRRSCASRGTTASSSNAPSVRATGSRAPATATVRPARAHHRRASSTDRGRTRSARATRTARAASAARGCSTSRRGSPSASVPSSPRPTRSWRSTPFHSTGSTRRPRSTPSSSPTRSPRRTSTATARSTSAT